jgi:hypothetical protein
MFVLLDPTDPSGPLDAGTPDLDRLTLQGPGGVVFGSAGNDFYPAVQVEIWDEPPPSAPGPWDGVETADFESRSGRLRVRSVEGMPAGPDFTAGPPGRYRLRAYCKGRGEAAERIGVELYYHGVEEWLIQIWPAAGSGSGAEALPPAREGPP